jgi:hypothetical protein
MPHQGTNRQPGHGHRRSLLMLARLAVVAATCLAGVLLQGCAEGPAALADWRMSSPRWSVWG